VREGRVYGQGDELLKLRVQESDVLHMLTERCVGKLILVWQRKDAVTKVNSVLKCSGQTSEQSAQLEDSDSLAFSSDGAKSISGSDEQTICHVKRHRRRRRSASAHPKKNLKNPQKTGRSERNDKAA
jgi:hypothetical protein